MAERGRDKTAIYYVLQHFKNDLAHHGKNTRTSGHGQATSNAPSAVYFTRI